MGLEQMLMLVGATIAGTFFAFSIAQPVHRHLYTALGVGGLSLIVFGYFRLLGM